MASPKTSIDTVKEMVKSLIRFDTTSSKSNLPLIDFVADYLASYDVPVHILYNDEKTKANLFATIGPAGVPGIVLSGHTDVVPVAGQTWDTDPFDPTEKDGRIYGRGTCDMKSFAGVALACVPDLVERDLKFPIHLAFSYDEEVGCLGVHGIIAHLNAKVPTPRAVIVGEPTDMQVVDAHKGIEAFRTRITGREAHSSNTHVGVNAIQYAAKLIVWLGEFGKKLETEGTDDRFTPPFTSVHVGLIEGGTQLNIIPKSCAFEWEFRPLPHHNVDDLLAQFQAYADELDAEMKAKDPATGIVTELSHRIPGLRAQADNPAQAVILRLARHNETHAVSYGTEAGIFQASRGATPVPTLVCGPGSILQAHSPNEFVEISQLEKCADFIARLGDYAADG